jgi:hypothetical protein
MKHEQAQGKKKVPDSFKKLEAIARRLEKIAFRLEKQTTGQKADDLLSVLPDEIGLMQCVVQDVRGKDHNDPPEG